MRIDLVFRIVLTRPEQGERHRVETFGRVLREGVGEPLGDNRVRLLQGTARAVAKLKADNALEFANGPQAVVTEGRACLHAGTLIRYGAPFR